MGFLKSDIAAAKVGVHKIAMDPRQAKKDYIVTKVRGGYVWVIPLNEDGPIVRLNGTASLLLISGTYR